MQDNVDRNSGPGLAVMLGIAVTAAIAVGVMVPRMFSSGSAAGSSSRSAPTAMAGMEKPNMMSMHMQEMQDHMAKIRATTDPQERQKLMDAHMEKMQSMMKMMEGMKMGGMGGMQGMDSSGMAMGGMQGMKQSGTTMGGMQGMDHSGMNMGGMPDMNQSGTDHSQHQGHKM